MAISSCMYATLSLKRLLGLLLPLPIFAAVIYVMIKGLPHNTRDAWVLASKVAAYSTLAFVVIGGPSGRWAPWRLIWSVFPPLNRWLFPDLNGRWEGSTNSNWPVIKAMLDMYEQRPGAMPQGDLEKIALQSDAITATITASFFKFRIEAELSSTSGKSHSVSARLCYDEHLERFELYYIYTQDTPEPARTDESSHVGAARLVLDLAAWTLEGEYWNKRSWRSGLNAAGRLALKRV